MARKLRSKISQAKWRCSMAAVGDGADVKMDRRTAADGNGRICESLVISTSEGGQTHHMTISRTDPFTAPGNTNNARTTIGIGELVHLNGMPGNTVWSVSGGGSLSGTNGGGVNYTAPLSPTTATINATVETAKLSVTFNIIAPNSVTVLSQVDWPPGTANPSGTLMGAETDYIDAIGPTNVSFDNVYFRENPQPASISITWPNGTNSIISFNRTTNGWMMACGQYTIGDKITSPDVPTPLVPESYLYTGSNYVNFSFGNTWTYQYQNKSGNWTDFYPLTYSVKYLGGSKQCQVIYLSKLGGLEGPFF